MATTALRLVCFVSVIPWNNLLDLLSLRFFLINSIF